MIKVCEYLAENPTESIYDAEDDVRQLDLVRFYRNNNDSNVDNKGQKILAFRYVECDRAWLEVFSEQKESSKVATKHLAEYLMNAMTITDKHDRYHRRVSFEHQNQFLSVSTYYPDMHVDAILNGTYLHHDKIQFHQKSQKYKFLHEFRRSTFDGVVKSHPRFLAKSGPEFVEIQSEEDGNFKISEY